MGIYAFDSNNSFFPRTVFSDPNPGTLTVTADGYYITTSNAADTFTLGGNWTVNILGTIGSYGTNKFALALGTPGAALSTVTIGAGGDVFGAGAGGGGIFTYSRTNITNKGTISGDEGIRESTPATGDYTITNTGLILANMIGLSLDGAGTHTIVNSGTIVGTNSFAIQGTSSSVGIDKVTNFGTIMGDVQLGLGDDTFTDFTKVKKVKHGHVKKIVKSGIVIGIIDLGDGNDVFKGGKLGATVRDGAGSDIYKFGAGDDVFVALPSSGPSGNDTVDGGPGTDTYVVSLALASLWINLDTIAHFGAPAQHAESAEIGMDIVKNFENAVGGEGADNIYGNAAANEIHGVGDNDQIWGFGGNDILYGEDGGDILEGGAGNDKLIGGAGGDALIGGDGNDSLDGGAGSDFLRGGLGKDRLEGGADGDVFIFSSISESGVGASKRDLILDFVQGQDVVDLTSIDAATNIAGDQAFHLVGNSGLDPFTPKGIAHLAGELRFFYSKGNTIIEGDVNNDAKADFQIELAGHYLLTNADFVF